jgi:phospholipase D1/2
LIEEGAEIGDSIAETAKGLIDPEPVDLASLRREFRVPNEPARSLHVSGSLAGTLAAALLGFIWAFVASPLGAPTPGEAIDALRSLPGGALAAIGVFVAAGLLLVPVTPLMVLTAVLFEPLRAAGISLLGCLASASASYAVGSAAGKGLIFRIAGADVRRTRQLLGRPGFAAMFLLRLVPLAPFPVVSLIAGASRICFSDFLRGTALGVLPSIGLVTLLTGQLRQTIEQPNFASILALIILAVFTAGVIVWVLRRISRLEPSGQVERIRIGDNVRKLERNVKVERRRRASAAHSK